MIANVCSFTVMTVLVSYSPRHHALDVRSAEMQSGFREMLDYTRGAVTRNASEKKINSLLDFVSTSTDMKLLQACSPI